MCLLWLFKHWHEDVKGLKSIACFQNVICSTWSEVSTHKHESIERGNCFNNITVTPHDILYFRTNGNLRNAAILVLSIATFKWSFTFQNRFNSIKICTDLHHRELSPTMLWIMYLPLPPTPGMIPCFLTGCAILSETFYLHHCHLWVWDLDNPGLLSTYDIKKEI